MSSATRSGCGSGSEKGCESVCVCVRGLEIGCGGRAFQRADEKYASEQARQRVPEFQPGLRSLADCE